MVRNLIFLILTLSSFTQFAQEKSLSSEQTPKNGVYIVEEANQAVWSNTGLKIEFGPNLGITHTDSLGAKHFYIHSTAIITNDSMVPIHLKAALSNEYEFPTFCGDTNKYKVFLVPKELTPDTATIYNNVLNGQHDFLNAPLDNPSAINKTLTPGEFCVVTIGVLIPKPTNCAAVPRAIFSNDDRGLYQICDSQKNKAISTVPQLEIKVKLEYYYKRKFITPEDGCVIIPFGQISYPEN